MLQRSWLGQRVSVRRVVGRRPDGRPLLSDVIGELVDLDGRRAVIGTRRGRTEVALTSVTAARLVVASAREELELQSIAARALRPAELRRLDGWVLRADPGTPRRVNSILTAGRLSRPLATALADAHDWYATRGRPVLVQVAVHARQLLDAELDARGWVAEGAASMLTAPLERIRAAAAPGIELAASPDDAWLQLAGGNRALVTRHDAVTFASVREAGAVVAVARGAVDDGRLALTGMVVDPAHRRRGLASALVDALVNWARERDAESAYLQVEAGNAAGLALYAQLGFHHHHDYHYRREPAG